MVFIFNKNLFLFVKLTKHFFHRFKILKQFILLKKNVFSNSRFLVRDYYTNKESHRVYIILLIKNLLRVFYKRYRTVILRRRLSRLLGNFRPLLLKWSFMQNCLVDGKFGLPLVFGIKSRYKSFKRNEWLSLLRTGIEKRTFISNLALYYDFLKKVIRYFPKRRLLLLNKVFVCRLRATRNNFFLTFYFTNGKALVTASAGLVGFKGKKKRTPLAAKKAAVFFSRKVFNSLKKLKVNIKNSFFIIRIYGKASSSIFKEALVGLRNSKFPCNLLIDNKLVAHSKGVRLKKPRRV